jgi:RHS repeat-associated protein
VFKDAAGVVSKTIDYTYDGSDRRIGKRIDGVTTERYVIDRNQIALVFDGAGNQTHRYLYGTQIDQVLADETSTRTLWALGDNQGTVRDLIDDGGNLVEHLSYDSFGKLSNASITGFRYGYTGREQDSETGLDYYRARYYDSAVGRFISEDPLGFAAGDSNIYRYVGNSPVNATDPSGLRTFITPDDTPGQRSTPSFGGGSSLPSGRGFGTGGFGDGLNRGTGGQNPRYSPGNYPRSRYQPSDLGPRNYGVPSNANPTPTPSNNPDIPSPNNCVVFKENERKLDDKIEEQGKLTKNRKCKYAYILRSDYDTRASVYSTYVSKSVYEFAVFSKTTGKVQRYDGITPGTFDVWEAKSNNDNEAEALRNIYRRGKSNLNSLNDDETRKFNKMTGQTIRQVNRSIDTAKECGFNFKYAVRSQEYKKFLEQDFAEFPKNRVKIQYIPLPGLDIFFR